MAEEKNIYLVRLNKLYHFLNDQDATVKIRHTNNGQQDSTEYSADSKEYSLKDLFSHGCEVSGRALKSITGNRSYIESKEIGRYKSITEHQKEVIKSIQYNFKEETIETSGLRKFSESKKDLYLKKNFTYYGFTNIQNTYPSVAEIKNNIFNKVTSDYELLEDFVDDDPTEFYEFKWDIGQLNDYFHIDPWYIDQSVKDKLIEIVEYRQKHFDSGDDINDSLAQMKFIITGIHTYSKFFMTSDTLNRDVNQDEVDKISKLLTSKSSWVDKSMYSLVHRYLQMRKKHKLKLPDHIYALALLIGAEIEEIQAWILKTVGKEINENIECSIRYSSESGKGESLLERGLTIDEVSIILEDFNFEMHPMKAFQVDNNNILDFPVYRYGINMGTDFIYDKSEFQYALTKNLFSYIYCELMKHLGISIKVDRVNSNRENNLNFISNLLREVIIFKNRP